VANLVPNKNININIHQEIKEVKMTDNK